MSGTARKKRTFFMIREIQKHQFNLKPNIRDFLYSDSIARFLIVHSNIQSFRIWQIKKIILYRKNIWRWVENLAGLGLQSFYWDYNKLSWKFFKNFNEPNLSALLTWLYCHRFNLTVLSALLTWQYSKRC